MLYKTIINKQLDTFKIFSLDSRLRRALVIFAFFCQIISGFTEWLGIAPFLIDLIRPFFNSTISSTIGNIMAVALALFLEYLVFYLVGFIIHAIRAKYWSIEGDKIDQAFNRIKFVSASSLLVVLVFVSMFLSKRNVKYQVAITNIEVPTVSLEQYDQKQLEQTAIIDSRYLSDKNDLDKSLTESKELIKNTYTAKITAIDSQISILTKKEQRTGNSYRTTKLLNQKKIDQLRTNQADELRLLRQKYDSSLQSIKDARNTAIAATRATISADKRKASSKNDKTAIATAKRNDWISWVLQIIASCAVLGFVVARSWVEMSQATAGVEKKVMPLQEFNGSSFWLELYLLCRLKVQRKLQNGIRSKLATIPDLMPIEQKGALLNLNLPAPQQTKTKKDFHKLFNTDVIEGDPYGFINFSKNNKSQKNITAVIEIEATSSEVGENLFNGDRVHKNHTSNNTSIIGRIGDRMPVERANLDNDRSKEKFKKKQRKRIIKYYQSYIKKYNKKPSYSTISNALNIAERAVGNYVRELKKSGRL